MDKIRKAIWRAVNSHFIITNAVRLETDIKYEKSKTIAQVIAIGLCNQYGVDREDVEKILCIESTGYDNKLKQFHDLVKESQADKDAGFKNEELKNFYHRNSMCARSVSRNLVYYMMIS